MFNVLWVRFYTWLRYINLLNIFHSLECVPIAWSYCIVLLYVTVQYMQWSHCVWGMRMCMCVVDWIQNKCILGETFQYATFFHSFLLTHSLLSLSLCVSGIQFWKMNDSLLLPKIPVCNERITLTLLLLFLLLLLLLLLFRENIFIEHTIALPEGWLLCLLYTLLCYFLRFLIDKLHISSKPNKFSLIDFQWTRHATHRITKALFLIVVTCDLILWWKHS